MKKEKRKKEKKKVNSCIQPQVTIQMASTAMAVPIKNTF